MRVHYQLPQNQLLQACALTVGTFDGVHRGHQLLVSKLCDEAAARSLPSVALTFVDMPFCYFRPEICPRLLSLADEKIEAFARTKLDHLLIVPFNTSLARQAPEEFTKYLHSALGLCLFVAGPDFALGKDRAGSISVLRQLGEHLGFEVMALASKLLENGAPISSTRSRGVIESGQVEMSRAFLGHNYTLRGEVISGQQLGRTLGVPTINLQVAKRKCLPRQGVYAVFARFDEEELPRPAAMNIGLRPTVDGKRLAIEFHVLNENIEAPPKMVTIEFIARLRDEKKFDGLEELKAQLHKDWLTPPQCWRRKLLVSLEADNLIGATGLQNG